MSTGPKGAGVGSGSEIARVQEASNKPSKWEITESALVNTA